MKLKSVLFLLVFMLCLTGSVFPQASADLPAVKYEDFRLKNGLRVILHHDKTTPIVAVGVTYNVGSKNESPGKSGFAHLFEHLMFQGSKNYNANFNTPLVEAGASFTNGVTTNDGTYYYEVVPSNFLEQVLFLEADRMGGMLDTLTQDRLDIQREVVKNERRQNYENQPFGTSFIKFYEEMFPAGHPYHSHPIGSMEDLSNATLDDVKAFFYRYYVPNNAVLSIAGDFDAKQIKQWIEKYFGPIPKGAEVVQPKPAPAKLKGEIRETVEDDIPAPRLYMAWHSAAKYHPDEAALDVLTNILNAGRGSRLQGSLYYTKKLVQNVSVYSIKRMMGTLFLIQATPEAGKTLEEVEKEINVELERLKKEPPTAEELARAVNQLEFQSIFDLQSVLSKSALLGEFAAEINKPGHFPATIDSYRKVTAADIQRTVNKYFTNDRLLISYVKRKGERPVQKEAAGSPATPVTGAKKEESSEAWIAKQNANLPKPGPDPKLTLPSIEKTKLSNGLEVWTVRNDGLPIISMNLVIKSGIANEPADRAGLSWQTLQGLYGGTKTRPSLEISNRLRSLGGHISANIGWDQTVIGKQTLKKDLDQVLDIFADIIMNPAFPVEEVENYRNVTLKWLAEGNSNPNNIANDIYSKVLYGNHPYGRPISGTAEGVKALSRDDLIKYHAENYRSNNAILIVVGSADKTAIVPKLEKAFSNWKPGPAPAPQISNVEPLRETTIFLIDKPGAVQSSLRIGQAGVPLRNSPDYFAWEVMNNALGFGVTSRLGRNLRESKGYTYEAGSNLTYFRNAGDIKAWGNVRTAVTKESIAEFMKEFNGLRGSVSLTPKELYENKQGLIRRYPSAFQNIGGISFQLTNMFNYGLPDAYFNEYIQKIAAVTSADIERVAKKYLAPDKMAIVVVGDRKAVEPALKELGYPIVFLDVEGRPVK